MFPTLRWIAVVVSALAAAAPLGAESLPGPPDWADSQPSVYAGMKAPEPHAAGRPAAPPNVAATAAAGPTTAHRVDLAIEPAVHEAPAPQPHRADPRYLSPPKNETLSPGAAGVGRGNDLPAAGARSLAEFGLPTGTLYTMASALGIVLGAFLLFVWLMRRGAGKAASSVPSEVVSVLGRVPIAARQFAQLLRVGNKLVLVSVTPAGADTLTEITDPVEVDRLVGLCQQYSPHSTTKAFEQVFRKLSGESAPAGFLGADMLPASLSSAEMAFRTRSGEADRG